MPLEKRSFMGGMNKDGDVRLIKNPDYIDALNVRAATSVDGTVGSLENIEGNVEVPFEFYSTASETFFVNDNGLYEEINASTVFYQKVIRIQGWEQNNSSYNFSLFSVGPNGNILVGEFNWNGNIGHTFTSFYLNSQFSSVGTYNSGINVYDINTGDQYTASVKILSFGQNAMLHGGYFDIVIECDVAGVNFNLSVSSNVDSDDLIYTYSQDQNGIPITASENLSIFLLPGFDTGGVYNSDANDDGIVISPNGTLYEVGNRTVWRIVIQGQQPTSSPASFDEINIYSYRENLNPANQNEDYEFLPFLTIDQSTFSSGDYEFDSNQNSLSAFFHNKFSEDKSILCDGLPLTFTIPAENFFLTFSENATFDGTNDFSIIVVGPVGVKFKLALASSSETLNQAFANGDVVMGDGAADFSPIFDNGSFISLGNYQIVENSIEITSSILDSYNSLQEELDHQIQIYGDLELISIQQNVDNNNLEQDILNQIALTDEALAELANTEANLALANQSLENQVSTITGLRQVNDQLQESNDAMIIDISILNQDLDEIGDQLNQIQALLNIAQGDLEDEQALTAQQEVTIADLNAEIVAVADALSAAQVVHAEELFNLQAELGGQIEGLEVENLTLHAAVNLAELMVNGFTQDLLDQDDVHSAEIAQLTLEHSHEVAVLIAQHEQALDDAESADQAAQDALQAQFNQDLADLTAQHNAAVSTLEGDITSLNTQLTEQGSTIGNLQSNVQELNVEIAILQTQLDEQRISDAIIVAKLNEYNEFYQSITQSYNSSLTLFNALSLSNQVIYEEDFSSSSDFANEWLLYQGIYEDVLNPLSSYNNSVINNPAGYENDGYLKLPADSGTTGQYGSLATYSAVRLPYSSLQVSSGWQHDSEVAIQMSFEVINNSTTTGGGLTIYVTNQWDDANNWDDISSDYGFNVPYSLTLSNGQNNPIAFSHSFIVNDPNNEFINQNSNITIIIPPVSEGIEIRLTNIRVGNDSQEMFAFDLNNQVPQSQEFYLDRYNEVNNEILEWQSSGLDTLSEFASEFVYNNILNKLIPGYSENPNISPNFTIGGRLQSYANAVFDFISAVQQQIYSQYTLYALASNVDISALQTLQSQHQQELNLLDQQIDEQQNTIEELESQLDDANNSLSSLDSPYNIVLDNVLLGDNVVSDIWNLIGPEPGILSEWTNPPTYYFGGDKNVGIQAKWKINGEDVSGEEIVFITKEEMNALCTQPHSPTNNVCTYITNRFTSGQAIEFEVPGGGYPTQVMHIVFANFDENTNQLTHFSPNPTVTASINFAEGMFDSDNLNDFLQKGMVQILCYFSQNEGDNVTFSDDIYLKRFDDSTGGNIVWLGATALNDYQMNIPKIFSINLGESPG